MPQYRDTPYTRADLAALVDIAPQNLNRGRAGRALATLTNYAPAPREGERQQYAYDEPGAIAFCEALGKEYDPRKAGR